MKKSFSKLFLAPLTVLVLASFVMAPVAEARGGAEPGVVAGVGVRHALAVAGVIARVLAAVAADRSTVVRPTRVPTMCAAAA